MKLFSPATAHRHLYIASASSLLIAGLLFWSFDELGQARQAYRQATEQHQRQLQQAQQDRATAAETARLQPLYRHLQARGLEEASSTAARDKQLLALQQALQIPRLRADFQPVQALPAPAGVERQFLRQTIDLQFDLLHEEDLLRFLEQLSLNQEALIITRQCQLSHPENAPLLAHCQLDWLSLTATGS